MLNIIPPRNPTIAITSNEDSSNWDTNADVVYVKNTDKVYCMDKGTEQITNVPRPIEATCMLDEAGCITTDSSKAKSILYQEVKDGRIITRQDPVSDMDREIAKLWNIVKEISKDYQKRELMWQRINKDLDRADQRLEENKNTSYWAYTVDGDCYTWEI